MAPGVLHFPAKSADAIPFYVIIGNVSPDLYPNLYHIQGLWLWAALPECPTVSRIMRPSSRHQGQARLLRSLFLLIIFFSFSQTCYGLSPEEIGIVTNRDVVESLQLANHYRDTRAIPPENTIAITTPFQESITRENYNQDVVQPIKTWLIQHPNIRCLVLMYGIPLRIEGDSLQDANQISDTMASVDSELALVKLDHYPTGGWLPNPHFIGNKKPVPPYTTDNILLVSRLDGSSPELVKRIIDDAWQVEQERLSGIGYFDARWPKPHNEQKLDGYKTYDLAIHRAAEITRKYLPVELEEKSTLFAPSTCPAAALYCGWYSLATYVDAFTWKRGAIAYHIASAECTTLKKKESQVWCKLILDKGAAVTIGPVGEPYAQAFPLPDVFFGLILQGRTTLVESYFKASPFISWKMVLIGDPLYRPFKYGTKRP